MTIRFIGRHQPAELHRPGLLFSKLLTSLLLVVVDLEILESRLSSCFPFPSAQLLRLQNGSRVLFLSSLPPLFPAHILFCFGLLLDSEPDFPTVCTLNAGVIFQHVAPITLESRSQSSFSLRQCHPSLRLHARVPPATPSIY